ncbi:TPA: Arc family DNA-binding protein [Citrobacter braakii]|nr:Arc family DNA-binding protein [Citrobacter braakii]
MKAVPGKDAEKKFNLRYSQELKDEIKKIAREEGMSENSAMIQGLVWWLKFREKMHDAL